MRPGKYKTARKGPKPKDMGSAPYYVALLLIVLIGYSIWASQHIFMNRSAVAVGKSVSCNSRPSIEMVRGCLPQSEGIACTYATRSQLARWWDDIDQACSKFDNDRPFVFYIEKEPETLEVAEVTG